VLVAGLAVENLVGGLIGVADDLVIFQCSFTGKEPVQG
jgi:hypothetical protein